MNWQPIETAPIKPFDKDNWYMRHSEYVLLFDGNIKIGWYTYTKRGKGKWVADSRGATPTHWMPLPVPP